MQLTSYLPILIQILLVIALAIGILIASQLLGQKAVSNKTKDSAYECGLVSEGNVHPRFAVKFYVTAMLFILFDIEVVFLVPWVLIYREFIQQDISILMPILFFFALLIVGVVYELKKGGVEWEK